MKFFAAINKVDAETRMVYGYASTNARDSQGEVVTQDAIKCAWDDYMKFANVREMHQPSAVGIVKEYNFDDNGTFIGAKVVDDAAWAKVQEGVYKGFSIGGKKLIDGFDPVTKTITGLKLTEISLVDRPANPDATFTMFKLADEPEGNTMQKTDNAGAPATTAAQKPEDELLDLLAKGDLPADKVLAFAKGLLVTVQVDGQGDNAGVNVDPAKASGNTITDNKPAATAGQAAPQATETSGSMSGATISATEKDPKDPTNASNLSNKPNAAKADSVSPLRKSIRALGNTGDAINKGMYDVACFADLLQQLQWLADGARYERDWEGDNSTVPEQIDGAIQTLAQVFLNMATEELKELQPKPDGGSFLDQITAVVQNSEAAPTLKKFNDAIAVLKAGKRNSTDDQERLQKAHDLLSEMGAACAQQDPAADATKHDHAADIKKSENAGDLQSLSKVVADLQKSFATQGEDLKKAHDTIAALQKAVGAQPSLPKALHIVGKDGATETQTIGTTADTVAPVLKNDGSVDDLATAIKKVHVGGGRLALGQR